MAILDSILSEMMDGTPAGMFINDYNDDNSRDSESDEQ